MSEHSRPNKPRTAGDRGTVLDTGPCGSTDNKLPLRDKSLDEKETKTDKLPDEVNRDREDSPEQSLPKSKPCMSQGNIQGQDSRFTDIFKKPADESVPETRHVVDDSRTDGGNGMQICVNNIVLGNTIYMRALPTDSIKSIKVRFAEETCHAPGTLILIVHGNQLEDGHTLADYNIVDGSTLHCLVRPETDKSLDEKETKTDKLPDEVNRDDSPEQSLPKSKPCMSQGNNKSLDEKETKTDKLPDEVNRDREDSPEQSLPKSKPCMSQGNKKSLDEKETKTDKLPDEVNRDREDSPEQSLPKSKPCMSQGNIQGQDSRFTDIFKKPADESVPETRHVVDDSRTDGGNAEVHAILVAEKPIPTPRTKKTKPIVQDTVTAEAQCDESDVVAGPEAELSVSAGSSVEIIPKDEGDQEITDVDTNFPLLSLPYGSMIPKCPSISDSASITDKFKENESNSSTVPRYTLKKVKYKYLLHVTGKSMPTPCPQLNGKSNVSVEKEFILIDDEFAYRIIEDKNGKITLDAFNEYTNTKESRPNTATQASAPGADNQSKVGHLTEKEIVVGAAQKTESMRLSANAERDKMQHHVNSRTIATALANDNQTVVDKIYTKTIVDDLELEAKMNNSGQDKIHTEAKHKTILFPKDNRDMCSIDSDDSSSSNPGSHNDTDSENDKNSLTAEGKQGMEQLVDAFHVLNIKSVGNGGKISSKVEGARSLSQFKTGNQPTSEPEKCRRASTQPQPLSQKEKPVVHARGRDDHTLSSEMSRRPARQETEVSAEGISDIPVVPPRREAEVSAEGISEIPVVAPRREAEGSAEGISDIPVVPPRREAEVSAEGISDIPVVPPRREAEVSAEGISDIPVVPPRREAEVSAEGISEIPVVAPRWEAEGSAEEISEIPVVAPRREAEGSAEGISEIPLVPPKQGKTKEGAGCQKLVDDNPWSHTLSSPLSKDGNKCHCMGSTEVVKKLENRLRPQTADGEKRRNKNEPQDLSLTPYLPKKDLQQVMKTRTIKVRSSNMLKVIQKSISVGEDIEITPIEKNGRLGFKIVGHDDDLIVATKRKIQSLQEEIKEEQITVGVSDEQLEHYETVISSTEQQCNVIINTLKLKQNKRKEEELTHETKFASKEWVYNGGQTLRLSYGQAKDCWKNLLIELKWQHSGSQCRSIVKNVGHKKSTELFIPQWTDDGGKCKHIVQDAIKTLLLQAKDDDCTHVCISLDEPFDWSIRQLTKQILKGVSTYPDNVIPVEFEMCLSNFEDFKECRKIIGETMPCGNSDNDSDEGQSLDKGNEDNQQRLKHIKVTVIKGQLNNMKADVLVNTTATDLNLHSGAVSQSLLGKAGDEMQKECKRKYPNGIKHGEIALTKGYKLNCKHVLHGALKDYDNHGDYSLPTLETFVMDCLKKASSLGHRSIAFPAIGTGNLGYPVEKVADVMFNCVRMFDEQLNSPKQVEDVRFVVYEKDQKVVKAFEKIKGLFEKGDGKIPRKPELPTSRQIRCSGITVDAQIGSLHTCNAAALLYLWDSTSLRNVSTKHPFLQQLGKDVSTDFFKKRQPSVFSTEGGKLGNRRVVHIPVKNSSKALMQGFRDGIRQADIEECCSAAVYFDTTSPFLVHQDQLAKELIEAVKDYGARFKHLRNVTLVAEGMHNSGKIFQAFENDQESVEEVSSQMKTSIRMHVNITGCDRDIQKAKQMLTSRSLLSKKLDSNDVTDTSISGADTSVSVACAAVNAPGPQSMNRTASPVMVASEQVEVPPDIEPFVSKMDCLQGYVMVSNVPPDYSYDELGGKLCRSGLPCGFKCLVYLKGTGKAVLVCNTSEDANKLSGYIGAVPFVFKCMERQVLGRFDFRIEKNYVERIKQQGQFDNFQKGLTELNATFKQNLDLEIQVETSYQLNCVRELKTRCMSDGIGSHCTVASKTDDFEHVVVSKVSIDDVSLKVWEVMKIEKQEAMQTFNDTCGSIIYADHTLTIRRNEKTSVEGRFDDYVKDFNSFVKQLKTMEFADVPVDEKFVQDIPVWTAEIDERMGIKCCTFSASLRKVIVYCDAYQDVCKVKHYFLVKQNKIKTTGRRGNPTQDTGESKQSLQPGYTLNTDKQSTDIIFQRPQHFEWIRDATNVETFKTSEGIQVYVYEANILKLPVDCIVNAANDTLQHAGGIAEVIAKKAGRDLVNEGCAYINKHGKLAVGHAMSTTAGKLAYKHVIHAVGPRWSDYSPHSSPDVSRCELDLSNAIYNSILEARKLKLKSIALPAISSAIFGVPEDLCVCMYVEATLRYSKDHTNFPVADIHFIDKNSRIISLLQHEFRMILNKGGISPYRAMSHSGSKRPRRYQKKIWDEQSSSNLSATEIPTNVHDVSLGKIIPMHECSVGKNIFSFCGRTDMRLLVYKGDVLAINNSAVVVTIDEKLNAGSIARGVCQKIPAELQKEYQSRLTDQLLPGRSVGQVAITKGFGSPFNSIIHVVFPTSARLKDETERRVCLVTVYGSIFNGVAKRTDAEVVTTTLIGIDEDNKNDVNMCAEAFLQGYISFVEETLLQRSAPFDVHLICRNDKNAQRICYLFKTYVTEQQAHLRMKSKESSVSHARDAPEGQHDSLKPMVYVDDEDGDCVICMDSITMPKQLKCGHKFCTDCIDRQFKFKKTCPTCGAVCGVITGDQPVGHIYVRPIDGSHCSGYADCGQIGITYTFPDGRQQDNHPNPGNRYKGINRTAYLPNNREGRQIRDMLKVAFDRKLVFTIGSSRTTGQEGVITWNDIHHKTDPRPHTQFGYPDKTYLSRVKGELADKGVTVEDIPK